MTEIVFVKGECETADVKEECVEEEDPLSTYSTCFKGNMLQHILKRCFYNGTLGWTTFSFLFLNGLIK